MNPALEPNYDLKELVSGPSMIPLSLSSGNAHSKQLLIEEACRWSSCSSTMVPIRIGRMSIGDQRCTEPRAKATTGVKTCCCLLALMPMQLHHWIDFTLQSS